MLAAIRLRQALTGAFVATVLASCHRGEQAPVEAKRISLSDVRSQGEQPLPSPDTKGASWAVSGSGQAIDFGRPGETPFVSLLCSVKAGQPQVTLVRHAPARPGEKALFPVIGNRIISRFKVDATLADREWRWQGTLAGRRSLARSLRRAARARGDIAGRRHGQDRGQRGSGAIPRLVSSGR